MIYLVTGTPGGGKSFYAMRMVCEALEAGKFVVTNVDLTMERDPLPPKAGRIRRRLRCRSERLWEGVPEWARLAATAPLGRRLLRPRRARVLARRWAPRLYVTHDLHELQRVRVPGRGEERAVAVIDEAHRFMNARSWNTEGRQSVVDWFTLHRKLGFIVYLITQDEKNIDRQVRDLFEYHVKLKNLRKMKLPVLHVPMTPCNVFVANTIWHGIKETKRSTVKRETYMLNRVADMYDTFGTSGGTELEPEDAIWLPLYRPGWTETTIDGRRHRQEYPALPPPDAADRVGDVPPAAAAA